MNRDAHPSRVEQSSSTAQSGAPVAGKQTLSQRSAEPPSWHEQLADPTIELGHPIQRSERGPAKAEDPSRAFAAAASGAFAEIPYRAEMESRFAADFSSVQSFAGRGLDDLGALAATRGEQVVFSSASPDRQTVAHELTHVLQSRQGLASGGKAMSDPGDASEREARGVASSLDEPAPPGKTAVSASPSGAIHRQDSATAPPPSHLDPTMGQARPIDWDAASGTMLQDPFIAPGFGEADSAREIYNYYLLHNLGLELPGEVAAYTAGGGGPAIPSESLTADEGRAPRAAAVDALLAFLNARMAAQLADTTAQGGRAAAEAIRVPLFRASQQALVSTLNVEQSNRYDQTRVNGAVTQTFCNVFAYDMVTAMGAYLPRVWWRDPAAAVAAASTDAPLDANVTNTFQLNANALYQWMLDWGGAFGWRDVGDPALAQAQANLGKIVVILAGLGVVKAEQPGHVSVVMAESGALGRRGRGDGLPLQAQAGEVNYSNSSAMDGASDGAANTATGPWWTKFPEVALPAPEGGRPRNADMSEWTQYASGYGFFVYEGGGHAGVSIRTPEETGLVLPAPSAEAASEPPATGT